MDNVEKCCMCNHEKNGNYEYEITHHITGSKLPICKDCIKDNQHFKKRIKKRK